MNWAFGLFRLLLCIPYLQDLIKVTQFMARNVTKSNPLLLLTSDFLITFDSIGDIALHFGDVGKGGPFAYSS